MKLVLTLIGSALLLASCSTVRGFGEDVQKAGNTISNAANRAGN